MLKPSIIGLCLTAAAVLSVSVFASLPSEDPLIEFKATTTNPTSTSTINVGFDPQDVREALLEKVAQATSMEYKAFITLANGATSPSIESSPNAPLTLILLALNTRRFETDIVHPDTLDPAKMREAILKPKPVTVVRRKGVKKLTVEMVGEGQAKGIIIFETPNVMSGTIHFRASVNDGNWDFIEFILPKSGWKTTWQSGGTWKARRMTLPEREAWTDHLHVEINYDGQTCIIADQRYDMTDEKDITRLTTLFDRRRGIEKYRDPNVKGGVNYLLRVESITEGSFEHVRHFLKLAADGGIQKCELYASGTGIVKVNLPFAKESAPLPGKPTAKPEIRLTLCADGNVFQHWGDPNRHSRGEKSTRFALLCINGDSVGNVTDRYEEKKQTEALFKDAEAKVNDLISKPSKTPPPLILDVDDEVSYRWVVRGLSILSAGGKRIPNIQGSQPKAPKK